MAYYSSESEPQPAMKSLKKHAATFIDIFDSHHKELKPSVDNLQWRSNEIMALLILGVLITVVGLPGIITACIVVYSLKQAFLILAFLIYIALVILFIVFFQDSIDKFNSNIGKFRRAVFPLAVELGKLKLCCEYVEGSLAGGLEAVNLFNLEKRIEELLCKMERLMDTESLSINIVVTSYFCTPALPAIHVLHCEHRSGNICDNVT